MSVSRKTSRFRRKVIGVAAMAVLAGVLVLPLTLFAALSGSPLIAPLAPLRFDDAARVKGLLSELNPRRSKPGEKQRVSVSERDCNLILNYALSRAPGGNRMSMALFFDKDQATVRGSLELPANPVGRYLNGELGIEPVDSFVRVTHLRIGWVRIPAFLINGAAWMVGRYVASDDKLSPLLKILDNLHHIGFSPRAASVVYEWPNGIFRTLKRHGRNLMFSKMERQAAVHYYRVLGDVIALVEEKEVSLGRLLPALFLLGRLRVERGGDPVRENRVLIVTLTSYCLGRHIDRLIGVQTGAERVPKKRVTLLGRGDLAKHYMLSAALAASTGSGLAHYAGVFKEVSDAQGGSGFSFADLLADRAGVKLGELAVTSRQSAEALQERMVSAFREDHFMPGIHEMPEGLQEQMFKHAYTDLDSASYKALESEIRQRISMCRVFRP